MMYHGDVMSPRNANQDPIEQQNEELRRAKELLEKNESRLIEAQAAAHVGSWETDLATLEVIWSTETYRIFELDPDTFVLTHHTFLDYVHQDDRERVDEAFKTSFGSRDYNTVEHRIVTPSGHIKHVEERWKISFDASGAPYRVFGTCQDISERKTIMNDLVQRNRDLEQFAYIISHNLRAPVANLLSITQLMREPEADPAETEQLLAWLSQSVNLVDTVIKDLNQILQVQREIHEEKTPVSLSKLFDDLRASMSTLVEVNRVDFRVDFSDVDEILTLRSYMYSIFYNLITNSIKYKRADAAPVIEISSRRVGDKIELRFKDNGLGIDLAHKGSQLFGLYKRFHFHTEGKGLGLFMVKTQVETLGGHIHVESEPNQGTEFRIEFG
jgi:PAS domain S-box-containing protein